VTGSEAPRRGAARLARVAIATAAVTAAVIVVTIVVLAWLSATTSGARWAFGRAPSWARAESIEGTLARGMTLRGVRISMDGLEIEAAVVRIEADWSRLHSRRIDVRRLSIEGLSVVQSPARAPAEPGPPAALPDVALSVGVRILDLRIDGASLRDANGESFQIETLRFAGSVARDRVSVERLAVVSERLDAEMNGELRMKGDYPLAFALHWIARPEGLPAIEGEGEVRGAVDSLEIQQRLIAPHPADVTLTLRDVRSAPIIDARVRTEAMPFRRWIDTAPEGTLTADARITGRADSLHAELSGRLRAAGAGVFDLRLEAALSGDTARIARLDVSAPDGSLDATASAIVYGIAGTPHGTGRATWTRFAWPGQAPSVESAGGSLRLAGSAAAWTADLDADLATELTGRGRWRASARGDSARALIESLKGDLLGGAVRASGEVRWTPDVAWDLSLRADSVDPGTRWEGWAGRLAAEIETAGHMGPRGPEGDARIVALRGSLRGRPIEGRGDVRLAGTDVRFSDLAIDWGAARLAARGEAGDAWSIEGSLDAPDLGLMWPGARGALSARASLAGPRARPRVTLRIEGDSLAHQASGVTRLELDADVDLSGAAPGTLTLVAQGLGADRTVVDRFDLTASGVPDAHEGTWRAARDADTLDARAEGAWSGTRWDAKLTRMDFRSVAAGSWRLERPVAILATGSHVELDTLELRFDRARLAASGAWDAEAGWRAGAELDAFPLARLKPWLPPNIALRGETSARLDARGQGDGPPVATLLLRAGPGEFDYAVPAGARTARFDEARADLVTGASGLRGTMSVSAPGLLVADGGVTMTAFGSSVPIERQPVAGRLQVEVPDLAPFAGFWPEADGVRGRVRIDLAMAGVAGRPEVTGEARLEDGAMDLREPGLELRDMTLVARADGGDSLALRGSARSGTGTATLTGRIDLARLDVLRANFAVRGERVEVMNRPEARLYASPDLRIAVNGLRMDVSGEVHVPKGDLVASRAVLREAAQLSPDVVIENRAGDVGAAQAQLHTRVRVVLGDSLSLVAFGLNANPRGAILFSESPGREAIASGELTLGRGTYRAYGQDLAIERGRLLFAGGPVQNPGLDIRAARTARDGTVAGIEVRGTALSPVVTVFSEPAMPEERALAYIVLGRPLEEAGSGDGRLVESAARSTGLKGGNLLARKVASRIGFDDAAIETKDGSIEEASLVLGTYLSPRVYVGYGVGLFKPANAFRIRYRLGARWAVEAEAADENSAEILFSIER
jgi:translocation and assembly module TamB